MKQDKVKKLALTVTIAGLFPASAVAMEFKSPDNPVEVTWTTDLTAGGGLRLRNPSCSLIGDPTFGGCGSRANTQTWSNGDDGNMNYKKGKLFSSYFNVTSELVLNVPSQEVKFVARARALYDPSANHTERTPLSDEAKDQIVRNVRLLDFFGEKSFATDAGHARVRLGNQVMNWGEAQFLPYGINQTNSIDYVSAAVPGQSLKQVILPAPMLSVLADLNDKFTIEGYYQFRWNKNQFAPVGSYWSASDYVGKAGPYRQAVTDMNNFNTTGLDAATQARLLGLDPRDPAVYQQFQQALLAGAFPNSFGTPVIDYDRDAKKSKQYGVRLAYRPEGSDMNFGFYYMRYTDKSPVFISRPSANTFDMRYLENRDLYGISANAPAGDWMLGGEFAYRPRDAVAMTGCYNATPLPGTAPTDANFNAATVDCPYTRDNKRFQLTLNGQINLSPSNFSPIGWLGADTGYFMAEGAWVYYPGIQRGKAYTQNINGQDVMQQVWAGGYWYEQSSTGYSIARSEGTANSLGGAFYMSLTYDGSIIPGWQVTPSLYHQQGLSGYSPGAVNPLWMKGVKATTVSLNFLKNPGSWSAGISYVKYWGGSDTVNPYKDRDMLGFNAKYTF